MKRKEVKKVRIVERKKGPGERGGTKRKEGVPPTGGSFSRWGYQTGVKMWGRRGKVKRWVGYSFCGQT